MVPLTRTWVELGFRNVPETRVQVERGPELFARLSEAEQRHILGPAAVAAHQAGAVELQDFVGRTRDRPWGTMRYARSLRDVLGAEASKDWMRRALDRRGGSGSGGGGAPPRNPDGGRGQTGDGEPQGSPISSRIRVPDDRSLDPVRQVPAAVDRVHGDGTPPELPVVVTRARRTAGAYEYDERSGLPRALEVSRLLPDSHLTIAHEIGHYLDHQALGQPGQFASESVSGKPGVRALMEAIEKSEAVQALRDRQGRQFAIVTVRPGKRERRPIDQTIVRYLLEPKELFARAYAEYVTTRSQDRALTTQMRDVLRAVTTGQVYHYQWQPEDFEPLAEGFDPLFRARGWRA